MARSLNGADDAPSNPRTGISGRSSLRGLTPRLCRSLTMRGLDRDTIDFVLVVPRKVIDEHDVFRLFVARDLSGHEFDDLIRGGGAPRALRTNRLDRLTPLRIRYADHHDID